MRREFLEVIRLLKSKDREMQREAKRILADMLLQGLNRKEADYLTDVLVRLYYIERLNEEKREKLEKAEFFVRKLNEIFSE